MDICKFSDVKSGNANCTVIQCQFRDFLLRRETHRSAQFGKVDKVKKV